jgi:DNA polymerase-3 subunit delta'
MALKDIIGQEKALHIIEGFIQKKRIPHALIFAGDEGIGKRLTAFNFAKALNCHRVSSLESGVASNSLIQNHELQTQFDACDECPSCTKTNRGNHPDVFIIGPEGEGGQITVSAIRQLEESLSFKPFEGKWKIAIIDNADRLNQSAANAFLQTLEEPSPQSILILVSSRPDMLLSTIRSRCQRINFNPLPVDTMSTLLEEKSDSIDHEKAVLLSILSGGRLGYALDDDLIAKRDRSIEVMKRMLESLEGEVWEDRDAMQGWFDWSQLWLRDIAVFKATGRTDLLINRDRIAEIRGLSRGATLKDVLKLARELYNISGRLNVNLNKQLTLNYTSLLLKKALGYGTWQR